MKRILRRIKLWLRPEYKLEFQSKFTCRNCGHIQGWDDHTFIQGVEVNKIDTDPLNNKRE